MELNMQGKARKIVQAILYEAIAVACVAPALELAFGAGMAQSTVLSVLMSGIAMSWNMAYNWAFERWEAASASVSALCCAGGCTRWASRAGWC
jgi:Predicted membrane protein